LAPENRAPAFARTRRALRSDGFRPGQAGIGAVLLLLALWAAWLFLARVPVYEVSESARVEAAAATHFVQPPVAARIEESRIAVGLAVKRGDVLLTLDARAESLALAEARARHAALAGQVETQRGEIADAERVLVRQHEAAAAAQDEAAARVREAETLERLASEIATRVKKLRESGNTSEIEDLRAQSEVARAVAASEGARLAIARARLDRETETTRQGSEIERLRREMARLSGDIEEAVAAVARAEHEVERRTLRAPIDGLLAEVANCRAGAFVEAGQKVAAIVPGGKLRVVASFAPHAAIGRIRTGQPARLRLSGFPSIEYGTVDARVAAVASEIRDGSVRVELAIDGDARDRIPLQHGLPGTLEVEIDRISPFAMILRAAGGRLNAAADTPR
jgi:membrane fusion protein (multidrug efflux system)